MLSCLAALLTRVKANLPDLLKSEDKPFPQPEIAITEAATNSKSSLCIDVPL
jgi:hypothetical protein